MVSLMAGVLKELEMSGELFVLQSIEQRSSKNSTGSQKALQKHREIMVPAHTTQL